MSDGSAPIDGDGAEALALIGGDGGGSGAGTAAAAAGQSSSGEELFTGGCLADYDVLKAIGKGKFSVVHKCRSRSTGEQFAVKVIDKRKLQPQERELLRTLNRLNRFIMLNRFISGFWF